VTASNAHRLEARRVITLAGYPPPADDLERARRQTLVDALADVIAAAELRGAGDYCSGDYCSGCGTHADEPNDAERREGCTVCAALIPDPAGGPLDTDGPEPVEELCPHRARARAADGLWHCTACGDASDVPLPHLTEGARP
jgi:hypothetical protein